MLMLVLALQLSVALCSAELQLPYGVRGSRGYHSTLNGSSRRLQGISVKITLYNAVTDTIFSELSQGVVVNIGSTPPGNFNIVADVTGTAPGSVNMTLTGAKSIQRIENGAPYALCGDSAKDFWTCNVLTTGKYNIRAVVYSGGQATGTMLINVNLDFELATAPAPVPTAPVPVAAAPVPVPTAPVPVPMAPAPVPIAPVPVPTAPVPVPTAPVPVPTAPVSTPTVKFSLYNGGTDTLVAELSQGLVVNIGSIPPGNFNIVADVTGTSPGSVNMFLAGAISIQKIENGAPYALCGNNGNDYMTCGTITIGKYNIRADVYSGGSATGTILASEYLDFELATVPTAPVPVPTAPAPVPTVPVPVPVSVPTTPVGTPPDPACPVPKLIGTWESWTVYPLKIAEALGGLVGDDFVVVSGFTGNWDAVTQKVYAYNTRDSLATWREMDDVPVQGFTHAAFTIDGLVMYICGGFLGPHPGPDTKVCLKFTPAAPKGQQWVRLPDMPGGRGGGGMNHIKETNSLVYSLGATATGWNKVDYNTTFELDLDDLAAGWSLRQSIPYKANHVSPVTAYYQGQPRYYWTGGQVLWNEGNGNQKDLFEWDLATQAWIRRADMTLARGHASTSTVAYGCGFIMAGGAINGGSQTADISYYGIDTNSWTSIGKLPNSINTPACDIVRNVSGSDWIYCQTGFVWGFFNKRIRISLT